MRYPLFVLYLLQVSAAHDMSKQAHMEAEMALQEAEKAKKISEDTRMSLEQLLGQITDFIGGAHATPSSIEAVSSILHHSKTHLQT